MREGKAHPVGYPHNNPPVSTENYEQKGDLLIRDLWQIGTDSIPNICVMNNYYLSHRNKLPEKCLQTSEKERRRIIWSLDSSNVVTSPTSLFLWAVSSAWRRRLQLNLQPAASQINGSIPTRGRVATLRVGWPSS